MNKIFKFITILFLTVVSAIPVNAKMNLFPEARYIPALDFYDESGKKYQLYDFNADLLIAVLWSRHCGPCIKDMLLVQCLHVGFCPNFVNGGIIL